MPALESLRVRTQPLTTTGVSLGARPARMSAQLRIVIRKLHRGACQCEPPRGGAARMTPSWMPHTHCAKRRGVAPRSIAPRDTRVARVAPTDKSNPASLFIGLSDTFMLTPPFIAPLHFHDPVAALEQVRIIHQQAIAFLHEALERFIAGERLAHRVRACYPFVRVHTATVARADSRLSYGFVAGPGTFETTLTRPDLFASYYLEQFRLLLDNHGVALEVGTSVQPIPVHFSFAENDHIEGSLSAERRLLMRDLFDLPDLSAMDDGIANGTFERGSGEPHPFALFTAPRVDYSLHRLRHYTGTAPEHFQNFVLLTNYQFYMDEFVRIGHELMAPPSTDRDEYTCFIEPGDVITRPGGGVVERGDALRALPPRLPQMPAYHLVREDRAGITMVNIGVGPANAKTITDHIAILRPHAWIMLGHCAGLRTTQQLGDYVLAHGYVREDHVLDEDVPLWVPIPPLAEVQR